MFQGTEQIKKKWVEGDSFYTYHQLIELERKFPKVFSFSLILKVFLQPIPYPKSLCHFKNIQYSAMEIPSYGNNIQNPAMEMQYSAMEIKSVIRRYFMEGSISQ